MYFYGLRADRISPKCFIPVIKDCYVAVAGLPQTKKDHALCMARFAMDCQDAFRDISSRLQITLGPGTGEQRFRTMPA